MNIHRPNIFINLLVNWAVGYIYFPGSASSAQNQNPSGSNLKGSQYAYFVIVIIVILSNFIWVNLF